MVGHLQVFVLSDWLSVNQPIEYLETTKGLRWLIPRQNLPWKKDSTSVWPSQEKLERKFSTSYVGGSSHEGTRSETDIYLTNSSYMRHGLPVPIEADSNSGWLHGLHSMRMTPYGLPLHSNEYFTYFLVSIYLSLQTLVNLVVQNLSTANHLSCREESHCLLAMSSREWRITEGSSIITFILVLLQ